MGVHSADEINEFGQGDLKVLSDMLADKPFFFGDDPTTVSNKRDLRKEFLIEKIYFSWTLLPFQIWLKFILLTKRCLILYAII